jgi:putative tricarboxylic transport membrane protein
MREIGIASPKRLTGVNAPTFREQGLGVEFLNWRAVFAAPGLSPSDVAAWSAAVVRVAKSAT